MLRLLAGIDDGAALFGWARRITAFDTLDPNSTRRSQNQADTLDIDDPTGLSLVPPLFAKPCLFLNWYPKTLYSVGAVYSAEMLGLLGYRVVDNTADEISAAVSGFLSFLRPEPPDGHATHFIQEATGQRLALERPPPVERRGR